MSVTIRAERIGSLLTEILGRKVDVKTISAFPVTGSDPTLTAVYETSEGTVVGACICDLDLVLNAGAALCLIPPYEVQENVKAKKWDPALVENFKEVLNICAQLFSERPALRVKLESVCLDKEARSPKSAALLAKPGKRLHLQLAITGYGSGRIAIFT